MGTQFVRVDLGGIVAQRPDRPDRADSGCICERRYPAVCAACERTGMVVYRSRNSRHALRSGKFTRICAVWGKRHSGNPRGQPADRRSRFRFLAKRVFLMVRRSWRRFTNRRHNPRRQKRRLMNHGNLIKRLPLTIRRVRVALPHRQQTALVLQ